MSSKLYKHVRVKPVSINDDYVVPVSHSDYTNSQSFYQSTRVYAGLFANFVQLLSNKGRLFVVPKEEPKDLSGREGIPVSKFDGVSLSSINRPYNRLFLTSYPKSEIEMLANPFALVTDGSRCLHTFFYQMPMFKLNKQLVELRNRSKLEVLIHRRFVELPGVHGITVFVDKDKADALIEQISNLPLSLKGDGFLVSRQWIDGIKFLTYYGEEVPVPDPVKMAGAARSKGITIARFEQNRVLVKVNDTVLPVHVIMNTQGKRLNKAANIVMSALRLQKYLGMDVEPIDATDVEKLKSRIHETLQRMQTGVLIVDGQEVGEVFVGINKFYFDMTHNTLPRVSRLNIDYVQVEILANALDLDLLDMFPRRDRTEQLQKLFNFASQVNYLSKLKLVEREARL